MQIKSYFDEVKMENKFYKKKKFQLLLAGIVLLLIAVYFILCRIASDQAEQIFRREMEKQQVLLGNITADSVQADIWGNVSFNNLVWIDRHDQLVLQVMEGKLKVNTLDIITKNIGLSTLQAVEINNAAVYLDFDDKMQLDILPQPEQKQIKSEVKQQKNIDLKGKVPTVSIKLNNCLISAQHKNRSFILNDVDAVITGKTDENITIKLSANEFAGTLVGDKLELNGSVDLKAAVPTLNMNLNLYDIVPKSMGLGDIKNTASVFTQVKGDVEHIMADGALKFKELDVPPLLFTDVNGNVHYEKGMVYFNDVTAWVYGGSVKAKGDYNIDTRGYNINAEGTRLMASLAAKSTKINCLVDLNFNMHSDGNPKDVLTYGHFKSGAGNYMLIPFESIEGKFSNKNKVLDFENVIIKTKIGNITTDGFSIVDGKVKINDIYLREPESGDVIKVR